MSVSATSTVSCYSDIQLLMQLIFFFTGVTVTRRIRWKNKNSINTHLRKHTPKILPCHFCFSNYSKLFIKDTWQPCIIMLKCHLDQTLLVFNFLNFWKSNLLQYYWWWTFRTEQQKPGRTKVHEWPFTSTAGNTLCMLHTHSLGLRS